MPQFHSKATQLQSCSWCPPRCVGSCATPCVLIKGCPRRAPYKITLAADRPAASSNRRRRWTHLRARVQSRAQRGELLRVGALRRQEGGGQLRLRRGPLVASQQAGADVDAQRLFQVGAELFRALCWVGRDGWWAGAERRRPGALGRGPSEPRARRAGRRARAVAGDPIFEAFMLLGGCVHAPRKFFSTPSG